MNDWASILTLTIGGNKKNCGDRTPSVLIKPDNTLSFASCINGIVNSVFDTNVVYPLNQWLKIKISQIIIKTKYIFAVEVSNKCIYSTENKLPMHFHNVMVYLNDPWHVASPGFIRNLSIIIARAESFTMAYDAEIKENQLLAILANVSKEYELSFDFQPTSYSLSQSYDWGSVITLTIGGSRENCGDRTPSILITPDNTLAFASCINGSINSVFDTKVVYPLNKWINIKISQINMKQKYIFAVEVLGKCIYSTRNILPMSFSNVKVYLNDPWHVVQPGFIRNLAIITARAESFTMAYNTKIKENQLLTILTKVPKEFEISFDFQPTTYILSKSYDWASVITMTIGGNKENCGDRTPSVLVTSDKTLAFASCINGTIDSVFDTKEVYPLKKWINIKISQINMKQKYVFAVEVLGKCIYSTQNILPMSFNDVKVYLNDPWHVAQPGFIKNLAIIITRTESITMPYDTEIKENHLLSILYTITKEFELTFDFKPTLYVNDWASVITLTIGGNKEKCGDQTPSVLIQPDNTLAFASCINGTVSSVFDTNVVYPLNQWIKIKISQININESYLFAVEVSNKVIYNAKNIDPNSFQNVQVYLNDPWHAVQPGFIRNLKIISGRADKNECNNSSKPCSWTNSVCTNTDGRYICTCESGWYLDENNDSCIAETDDTGRSARRDVTKSLWKVLNKVTQKGSLLTMNLQIYSTFNTSLNATVEFEYFLPPYISFIADSVIASFVNTDTSKLKYNFTGVTNSTQLFNYNFTAIFNDTQCPIPGAFTLYILLKIKTQVESEKSTRIYKAYQQVVECIGYPKIPYFKDELVLEESYGRGLYWDAENSNIYVCMNQHFPSIETACYVSNDKGTSWLELDVRIGSVLGHHFSTKELYAIHRNQKTYMVFNSIYNKWLSITNQQFKDTASSFIDPKMRINLEGDYDQFFSLGPNQWLGNAQGLFIGTYGNASWILRIKWRF